MRVVCAIVDCSGIFFQLLDFIILVCDEILIIEAGACVEWQQFN